MPRRLTVSIPAERLQAASGAAGERPQFAPIAASDARPTNLIAGPLFYLAHAVWNYFGSSEDAIDLAALTAGAYDIAAEPGSLSSFTISRALAKIITFRVIASAMDFASNYFAVRDVGSALILSASGLILWPFVYFGHEKVWDYFNRPAEGVHLPGLPLLFAHR